MVRAAARGKAGHGVKPDAPSLSPFLCPSHGPEFRGELALVHGATTIGLWIILDHICVITIYRQRYVNLVSNHRLVVVHTCVI